MPELPDEEIYDERLQAPVQEHLLEEVRVQSPCLPPMLEPPVERVKGARVAGTARPQYVENEASLCAKWQIGGRLLAQHSLSRLRKSNGPQSIDELERS